MMAVADGFGDACQGMFLVGCSYCTESDCALCRWVGAHVALNAAHLHQGLLFMLVTTHCVCPHPYWPTFPTRFKQSLKVCG